MTGYLPLIALLALLLATSACRQEAGPGEADATAGAAADTARRQGDVAFVDSLVPHHRMSIYMSDMVLELGERREVRALAERMKRMQTQEIEQMKAARLDLTGSDSVRAGMQMDPMMQATMDSMRAMHGGPVDRMFLRHMIRHHEQGIGMIRRLQGGLQRAELQALADSMAADQQKEIEEMRSRLGR